MVVVGSQHRVQHLAELLLSSFLSISGTKGLKHRLTRVPVERTVSREAPDADEANEGKVVKKRLLESVLFVFERFRGLSVRSRLHEGSQEAKLRYGAFKVLREP